MGAPKDDSGKVARKQQQQLEANVAQGKQQINTAFEPFDDDYYGGVTKAYTGFYEPQLDKQFGDAQHDLTAQLADQGVLHSSIAAKRVGDLQGQYNQTRGDIASQGVDQANQERGQVEGQRSKLYSSLSAGLSPSDAAQQAAATASQVKATPTYGALGSIFGSLLGSGIQAAGLQARGYPGFGGGGGQVSGLTGTGTSREVQ